MNWSILKFSPDFSELQSCLGLVLARLGWVCWGHCDQADTCTTEIHNGGVQEVTMNDPVFTNMDNARDI